MENMLPPLEKQNKRPNSKTGDKAGDNVTQAINVNSSSYIITAGMFSLVVNILMLVSPLYMLQVYDRILTSGSIDTLILISLLAVFLLITYAIAEGARRRVMAMASSQFHRQFGRDIFKASLQSPRADHVLPKYLVDLSIVQAFVANGLLLPLFDLIFTPLFLIVMFLVHPIIGWIGVLGTTVMIVVGVTTELWTREPVKNALKSEQNAQTYADSLGCQQSAIVSLGMSKIAYKIWMDRKSEASALSQKGTSATGLFGSMTRGLRQILQIATLGAGAVLVLQHQSSPGAIVAGTILLGRALAPIDQIVGGWRQYIKVRGAWASLNSLRKFYSEDSDDYTKMPRPEARLGLENLGIGTPGAQNPLLPKFNLDLKGSSLTVVVGVSGCGKTSMLQTISGAWPAMVGKVMFGGRDLHRWDSTDRGQYIGYIPQNVELLTGSVAQNISRFTQVETDDVIAIAKKIGCHEIILGLSDGYDTIIGPGGVHLSAGQKQVIGIARAGFGNPVLMLLDEPTANLDHASVQALKTYLFTLKEQGIITVLATHDLRLTELADNVIMLSKNGIKMVDGYTYFTALNKAHPVATMLESKRHV